MELYKRILQLIDIFDNNSQTQAARRIGIPQKTLWGYLNEDGQVKIKKVFLDKIFEAYPGVRRDWLYFGEGEMLESDASLAVVEPLTVRPSPAVQPVQGSPAASIQLMLLDMRSDGWGSPAPIPALTALPELHEKMVAVVAPDDRLRLAGVEKGQVCYCDAALRPQEGEPVLVRLADGRAALLVYAGRDGGRLLFTAWGEDGTPRELAADEGTAQLAPVVLIRRRM